MPNISIILPIYNVEKYLEQCLSSVAQQTLQDIEIICVDDGSTDGSPTIIDEFAANDRRFVPIHKQNAGYGAAVNAGIDASSGEYIGIVEPDDYIASSMYEKLLNAAKECGDPDIVKAAYWRVINADSADEKVLPANYFHCPKMVNRPFRLSEDAEFLYHHPSIWTAIYRKGFLETYDIRMHEIPGAGWADNPWLIETLAQAESIVYIDECLYYYRESIAGSSSVVKDPSVIYDRWLDMDAFIAEHDIESPLILEGHNNRGCAYIEMLQHDFDHSRKDVQDGIGKMLSRMDKTIIAGSRKIPTPYKEAYFRALGGLDWLVFRAKRKLSQAR